VDGTGSGPCPVAGSGTFGFCYESQLISEMDLRGLGCEDGRWMELAQDHVQWRALVLAVFNLRVLLPNRQCSEEQRGKQSVLMCVLDICQ
jgi:hypothetical protein